MLPALLVLVIAWLGSGPVAAQSPRPSASATHAVPAAAMASGSHIDAATPEVGSPPARAVDEAAQPTPSPAALRGADDDRTGAGSLPGAALLLIGLALMVAEGVAPSFGVLGIGGVLAFVGGAGWLIHAKAPGLSLPLVAAVAVMALACVLVAVRLALAARRQALRGGTEALVGQPAQVLDWAGQAGHVLLGGERWQASAAGPLVPGQPVRVRAVNGLRVEVVADGAAAPASSPTR